MALGSKRQSSHTFARVPKLSRPRSVFTRDHGYKSTFNAGYLIPFFFDEVVPGDSHRLNCNMFARLATLKRPIMDNLYLETFFFFCPSRILWDNWERMWGSQDNPGDSTDFLVPVVELATGAAEGSIYDYLGIPIGVPDLKVNALYLRAINKIWNDWFRDENLQDSVPIHKGDGPDPEADYTILRRGKRHDYFTSALPWPQKGPEVFLPIGGAAIVPMESGDAGYVDGAPHFQIAGGGDYTLTRGVASGTTVEWAPASPASPGSVAAWLDTQLKVGFTASTATINDFREAVVTQQFYEMLARGGSRYTELLQALYGVSNGDARLQRAEYLGGGRTNVFVNPVVNTTGQVGGVPQGDLAGYGVGSATGTHGFSKSFTEHGVIIGFVNVRADLNYQQGVLRQFSRRAKLEYLVPHFANIGEQAIYNREIYAQGDSVLSPSGVPYDEEVFGYVGRYDDYRYKPNMITGQFRSASSLPLDMWHLAQDFGALPTLSSTFIEENPPIERIVSVPDEPHFLLDTWNQLQSVRELPTYSVPGIRRI